MITIFENSISKVQYESNKNIIQGKFSGTVNTDLALETFNFVIEFAIKNKIRGIITDLTELKGTYTMLNDYLTKTFYPTLIKQGLICNALVMSKDIFTQFATTQLTQNIDKLKIQIFKNWEEGYNWVVENLKNN